MTYLIAIKDLMVPFLKGNIKELLLSFLPVFD
jgi:hypothetical protein